jgi:arylsulfatase A-like enzyme
LLLPLAEYSGSTADNSPYEGSYKGETAPVFPHDLPKLKATDSELIRRTPMGNTYTLEFVKAAIESERLGEGAETDFLAFSLSSTDYVGHQFGINALETEDTYLRLDRELADLIDFIDKKLGRDNYVLFLTADHGACANPEFNADHQIPSGNVDESLIRDSLKVFFQRQFGDSSLLLNADATGIFLNRSVMEIKKLDPEKVESLCSHYVLQFDGVSSAWTGTELSRSLQRDGIARLVQRGFNFQRSADVCIQLQPGWIDWFRKTGTTHGTSYAYDTHVPVLFFGAGISPGATFLPVSVCDIAPTIASLLHIQEPSGTVGKPILPVLE